MSVSATTISFIIRNNKPGQEKQILHFFLKRQLGQKSLPKQLAQIGLKSLEVWVRSTHKPTMEDLKKNISLCDIKISSMKYVYCITYFAKTKVYPWKRGLIIKCFK